MEKVIKDLTADVLMDLGFSYDGYYWGSPNVPFKLQSADQGYTVFIEIPGAETPPPVMTNSDLLRLMCSVSTVYLQKELNGFNPSSAEMAKFHLNQLILKYFNFNPSSSYKMAAILGPQGIGITPANEFTFTVLNGVQCEFKVYLSGDKLETVYIHPECMSGRYLKELFPDDEIDRVEVLSEGGYEPFFGCGMHKPEVTTPQIFS